LCHTATKFSDSIYKIYYCVVSGRGIFAIEEFQAGNFLLEYRGERPTREPETSDKYVYEFIHNGKRMWCVFF